jgi:hypothetical protein
MTQIGDALNRRHGGVGITSFCISLVSIVGIFVSVGFAVRTATPEHNTIAGLALLLFPAFGLVGIGLAVAGLWDRMSKKIFPILGLTICLAGLLMVGVVLVIGLSMKG